MLCNLLLIITLRWNKYFFVQENLSENNSLAIHQFIVKNNLFEIISPFLILLTFLLVYKFLKIKSEINNQYVENNCKENFRNKETQFYFLSLGIIIPLLEIVFTFFNVRSKSLLIQNFSIGAILLALYFISKKSTLIFQNLQSIFKGIFLIVFIIISRNIIYTSPDIIPHNRLYNMVLLFL